jgi:hypothetical protein
VAGNIPCSTADCTSECSRCDFPATPGECTHFDYASTTAPLSDPDYTALCSKDHVRVVCRNGVCESTCEERYANCDGRPLREGGCETERFTAAHCQQCEACRYGFCSERDGCVAHIRSPASLELATSAAALEPSKVYATLVPLPVGDRKLRALGALIDAKVASLGIQLAIYHQRGTSLDLLHAAMPVASVDSATPLITAREDVVAVEVLVPGIALPTDTAFMIAVQVPTFTQFKSEPGAPLPWISADAKYGEFPVQFPPDYKSLTGPPIALYAVTTPE